MQDEVDSIACAAYRGKIAQVAFVQVDLRKDGGKIFAAAGGEVIQRAHIVSTRDESMREVRPDEACGTGDKVFRHPCLSA